MASVEFKDFTIKVQGLIDDKINAVLEECAGEVESEVKRNSRVDTGKTKNSFRHQVDSSKHTAYIGSSDENAIWEEYGTGEYASMTGHQGRQGEWTYKDAKGVWHKTTGKKPSRAFHNAYVSKKNQIVNHIQNSMKGL